MSQNTSHYPVPAEFAAPATTEAYIIKLGIHSRERLTAVMSRPDKSPELLTLLVNDATTGQLPYSTFSDARLAQHLLLLLAIPAVTAQHLRTLAEGAIQHLPPNAELLTALCIHPHAKRRTVITTLWYAAGLPSRTLRQLPGSYCPPPSTGSAVRLNATTVATATGRSHTASVSASWRPSVGGPEVPEQTAP